MPRCSDSTKLVASGSPTPVPGDATHEYEVHPGWRRRGEVPSARKMRVRRPLAADARAGGIDLIGPFPAFATETVKRRSRRPSGLVVTSTWSSGATPRSGKRVAAAPCAPESWAATATITTHGKTKAALTRFAPSPPPARCRGRERRSCPEPLADRGLLVGEEAEVAQAVVLAAVRVVRRMEAVVVGDAGAVVVQVGIRATLHAARS